MEQPEEKEYKNDNIELRVTESAGCRVEFTITLLADDCQQAYSEALKEVQKKAALPGFRKGRVPKAMIEKQFAGSIEERWRELVAQRAFRASVQLANIYPWDMDQVRLTEFSSLTKESADLTFQFEREPQVAPIDPQALSLPAVHVEEPSEETVDQRIERYQEHQGSYTEIADKEIEQNDYVRVDVHSLEEDPPKLLVQDERVQVGRGRVPDWLMECLTGMKVGDEQESTTQPNPDLSEEERENFQSIPVKVTVRAVEELKIDEEAFVKAMGVETMEEVRERAKKQLEREAEEEMQSKRRMQLWQQLMANVPIEIPHSMLDTERRRMARIMVAQLRQQQGEEAVLAREQEIEAAATQEAIGHLYRFFVARQVCADAGKTPTEQDIVTRAVGIMMQENALQQQQTGDRDEIFQRYRNEAFYQLLLRNAEDYLLQVVESPES